MKKLNYFIVALAMLATTQMFAQVTNTVTLQADLTQLIADGFDATVDTMTVQGLDWDGGNTVITGDRNMTDSGTGNIFTTTLTITTDFNAGDSLRWKFRAIDPDGVKFVNGGWEGGFGAYDGYPLYLQADGSTFTDGAKVPGIEVNVLGISNTIEFSADLSGILGTGAGFFDPATDKITVAGLDWDGLGTVTAGERVMVADEFTPGLFTTSLTVSAPAGFVEGDSTKWKFKAEPGDKFSNGGWETGSDRWHHYVADGTTVTLPVIVPNIDALLPPIDAPIQVRFKVDLSQSPVNSEDNSALPVDALGFIGIKGADSALGAWAGAWEPADTTVSGSFKGGNDFRQMVPMNDSGVNGDEVAGDKVWSVLVSFPIGTAGGTTEYKYGSWYDGASAIKASQPMDNEGLFGTNHNFKIMPYGQVVNAYNVWGDFDNPTGVRELENAGMPGKYSIEQNYPNPFNPSTMIKYSIPEIAKVSISVFNLLGEKVATLVNQQQAAGTYEVDFNASRLSSGIYFYTISAGNFVQTKKMMLLK